MRSTLVATALCGVLTVAACGQGPVIETQQAPAGWRWAPEPPLSPRTSALGLWTGREALLIGGSDEAPCPPSASCRESTTPRVDGAAFDPATNVWRRIADSPVPLSLGSGVVIGPAAYILPAPSDEAARREILVYRTDRDSWTQLPVPFDVGTTAGYRLLAAGDRLVAYAADDDGGQGRDYTLDPRTEQWSALPADPLSAAYDRAMAWTGRELVLFDHDLVADPGAEKPPVTRAAALDLTTGTWRRLPDSAILSTNPWILAGGKLVNPTLGGEDGGAIGNWGRTYPYGGILDPATGQWSPLPDPPGGNAGGGARTPTSALYLNSNGPVLNTTTGLWQAVPAVPGGNVTGRTVVAAGVSLLVFGGAQWSGRETKATLLRDVWIWSPGP